MTPKREAWWDSLPKEEKQVREAIKEHVFNLKGYKFRLLNGLRAYRPYYAKMLRQEQLLIKALRKQIAMKTTSSFEFCAECPACGEPVLDAEANFCAKCGQKIKR